MLLGGIAMMAACTTAVALPGAVAVPVDVADGRCVVAVLLDGRVARMVVDTGAERTLVTRAAAQRLGLRRDLWVDTPMEGAGGQVERHPNVDVGSPSLGKMALFQETGRGLSLAVTDLNLGDADGLLGSDLLRHFTLDLDMPKARLVLLPAGGTMAAGNCVQLRPWARGLLLCPVRVDQQELTALVDTGAGATLINARGLHRLGITAANLAGDPVVTPLRPGREVPGASAPVHDAATRPAYRVEPWFADGASAGGRVRSYPGFGHYRATEAGSILRVA